MKFATMLLRDASLLAGFAAATMFVGLPQAANAVTLHGFCSTASPCTDNGTNTPTSVNPPQFGFSAGGHSETGTVMVDILVPDNVALPANYKISGPLVGASTFTASLFSSKPWTSGKLDSYLGISASPANPIGAFLPSTLPYDPTATGFYIFSASLGTVTLPSNSGASNATLLSTDLSLFAGSYIVAFINQGGGTQGATANSGAIFETGPKGGVPEPSTWAMMILGVAAIGANYRKARNARTA